MNRKLSKSLALASALAFSSIALAQDGETVTFSWFGLAQVLGPVAMFIWLILFTKWGGFRYLIPS
jgi:hypothetical protein